MDKDQAPHRSIKNILLGIEENLRVIKLLVNNATLQKSLDDAELLKSHNTQYRKAVAARRWAVVRGQFEEGLNAVVEDPAEDDLKRIENARVVAEPLPDAPPPPPTSAWKRAYNWLVGE